jgi:hypothetical protein
VSSDGPWGYRSDFAAQTSSEARKGLTEPHYQEDVLSPASHSKRGGGLGLSVAGSGPTQAAGARAVLRLCTPFLQQISPLNAVNRDSLGSARSTSTRPRQRSYPWPLRRLCSADSVAKTLPWYHTARGFWFSQRTLAVAELQTADLTFTSCKNQFSAP